VYRQELREGRDLHHGLHPLGEGTSGEEIVLPEIYGPDISYATGQQFILIACAVRYFY